MCINIYTDTLCIFIGNECADLPKLTGVLEGKRAEFSRRKKDWNCVDGISVSTANSMRGQ